MADDEYRFTLVSHVRVEAVDPDAWLAEMLWFGYVRCSDAMIARNLAAAYRPIGVP